MASKRQLAYYLQRIGWLIVGQSGAFTEEMLPVIRSNECALVFVRLPELDTSIPEPFLDALRQHPAVVVTSPYPHHLFSHLNLHPLDFLTEPYSFERFTRCMERYFSRHD
ncbi:hypothetical protein WBJ53_23635 [Spirosoma sp. SC4-14]|uniref:hypothetical protein n=1 Tax=Spirosoma sp. SC4-14 TaxID=3128900 RepID=UPI0030CB9964